jgi:hypothetical protein
MNTETRSITIARDPRSVFAYVSRPENLPVWATPFAESIRAEDDYWIATNATGETSFTLRSDEASGVVDFLGLIAADAYVLRAPTRVVPNGPDQSEYLFTLFQVPRESDEAFAARVGVVSGELETLKRVLESPSPS